LPIGNDLVDLGAREARGKAEDRRFLNRVFTEPEKAWILRSPEPDLTLWICWTAKEAAFKVARKLRPAAVFAHRAYEVRAGDAGAQRAHGSVSGDAGREKSSGAAVVPGDPLPARPGGGSYAPGLGPSGPTGGRTVGRVEVRGALGSGSVFLPVEWEVLDGRVHCLARSVPGPTHRVWSAVDEILPEDRAPASDLFTERECAATRSPESWAVRRLAKRIAEEAGIGPVEVLRQREGSRLGPPRLHAIGAESPLEGWDVSLSHDGRFVAAAVMRLDP
jgi:phosphopantetheinyl transferase (holo-ACP synthase)